MAKNKIIYNGNTLIDLTGDTVTAETLMQGYTAHDRSGAIITGTATGGGTGAISVVDTTDTHGGTIRTITAVDISDTTAVASDVAQGKYFYTADGTKTTGTASGGGSATLKMGVIRPDAELVQRWSEDALIVEDLGLTIPTYSTSDKTIRAATAYEPTVQLNMNDYFYILLNRGLVKPIYDGNVTSVREDYYLCTVAHEIAIVNSINSSDGRSAYVANNYSVSNYGVMGRIVCYNSSNNPRVDTYTSKGFYMSIFAPTISKDVLTVRNGTIHALGASGYMESSAWSHISDVRIQQIAELYRVPQNSANIKGWSINSQAYQIIDDINNGGTLT